MWIFYEYLTSTTKNELSRVIIICFELNVNRGWCQITGASHITATWWRTGQVTSQWRRRCRWRSRLLLRLRRRLRWRFSRSRLRLLLRRLRSLHISLVTQSRGKQTPYLDRERDLRVFDSASFFSYASLFSSQNFSSSTSRLRRSMNPKWSLPPKWSASRRSLSWRPRYEEHTYARAQRNIQEELSNYLAHAKALLLKKWGWHRIAVILFCLPLFFL